MPTAWDGEYCPNCGSQEIIWKDEGGAKTIDDLEYGYDGIYGEHYYLCRCKKCRWKEEIALRIEATYWRE